MNEKHEFKVGEKVSVDMSSHIGTVIRISQKRGDITVEFKYPNNSYTKVFDKFGREKNGDRYSIHRIYPLTEELSRKIANNVVIATCLVEFEKRKKNLTAEKAERIIKILREEN